MNRPLIALAGAAALAAGFATPAAAQQRVRAGVLTCDVSAGIGLIAEDLPDMLPAALKALLATA